MYHTTTRKFSKVGAVSNLGGIDCAGKRAQDGASRSLWNVRDLDDFLHGLQLWHGHRLLLDLCWSHILDNWLDVLLFTLVKNCP